MKKLLAILQKLLAPGFESAKGQVIKRIDWAIQAVPGIGVPRAVATLKRSIEDILGKAHLPGTASLLLKIALSAVNWEKLLEKPADLAIAELEALKARVKGARL